MERAEKDSGATFDAKNEGVASEKRSGIGF